MFAVNATQGDIFIGSMILAAQSSTLASAVVLTASANGNVPLALIITIINNMTSAVLTPLVLKATLSLSEPRFVQCRRDDNKAASSACASHNTCPDTAQADGQKG